MNASDRELLSALADHSTAPRIFDIHLDDCEDDACTGCEPQHLAEQVAAKTGDWPLMGGHTNPCAYAAGISPNCTCGGESRG